MQLNLRQIEVFRAVMTAGSISGAAKLLYVSQPAVILPSQHPNLSSEPIGQGDLVSSPHNACSLVKAGGGIAIVDEFSAHSAAGDFVVRPIAHTKTLAINLVQSRFEPLSQLAQDFAHVLRDTINAQGFAMRES